MMLLSLLKALGLDIPAAIAAVQGRFDRRIERATDEAKAAIRQAALTAMLVTGAAATAAAAFAVVLLLLDRWVAENHGEFAGYGVVAIVLAVVSLVLGAVAWTKSRRSPEQNPGKLAGSDVGGEGAAPVEARTAATDSDALQRNAASSATVLIELLPLLAWLLAKWPMAKWPTTSRSTIEALTASLRRTTKGKTMQRAINQIAEGGRVNLLAAVAGAVLLGWLMARRASRDQHAG